MFNDFLKAFIANVQAMCTENRRLYQTAVPGDKMWETYLSSFPEGTNPMFRERTEHDCNCCRSFIRRFGGIVAITPQHELKSVWDFESPAAHYQPVIDALAALAKSEPIQDPLVSKEKLLGTKISRALIEETQKVETWQHLHIELPKAMTLTSGKTEDSERGRLRTDAACLQRALEELSPGSVSEVLELIAQGSLYRGEGWVPVLSTLKLMQAAYAGLALRLRGNFCWDKAASAPEIARIRNSSIGTLLVDLSEDMDLDQAVLRYERVTAPSNYQRPKALVTTATLAQARKTIEELGILDSLPHRFAHLDDITVNNVLWANRDAAKVMRGNVLDDLAAEVQHSNPRKFDRVEEMSWDKFVKDVLPGASQLEVMMESRLTGNLASLLAPVNRGATKVFQWDNGFCWAYYGNMADSMKERVKAAGGDVTGVLRFSIQWNEDGGNANDMDAHCRFPANGGHIYFGRKQSVVTGGTLDVDIIHPSGVAVENITWPELRLMPDGDYEFSVHCYSDRGGKGGFRAEIEANGEVWTFDHPERTPRDQYSAVAVVTKTGDTFKVKPAADISTAPGQGREVWGLTCGQFVPVSAVMYSPNYWDRQLGRGHRHLMFMLANCVSDQTPHGFFNEYLRADLKPHRRVFEVLGGRLAVEPDDTQMSGLGFSITKLGNVLVKVAGAVERPIRVTF